MFWRSGFNPLTHLRHFHAGVAAGVNALERRKVHINIQGQAMEWDGILHITLPAPQQQKALPVNPNLIEIE